MVRWEKSVGQLQSHGALADLGESCQRAESCALIAPIGAQKVLRILVPSAAVLAAGKRDFQNRRQVHHEERIDFPSAARNALRPIR